MSFPICEGDGGMPRPGGNHFDRLVHGLRVVTERGSFGDMSQGSSGAGLVSLKVFLNERRRSEELEAFFPSGEHQLLNHI